MNIGNITSDNFNLDGNGKDIQIEVYEQLIEQLQQENKHLDEVNCKSRKTNEQLKDNWNDLKKYAKEIISTDNELYGTDLLDKMQELEQGSDSNE